VAWQTTSEPLILCYGNINRSPFAAELARLQTGTSAKSAGLYAISGRPASDDAVRLGREYGIDLLEHRSNAVGRDDLRRAGAIFVFDLEDVARIACREQCALRRTHFLASLAPNGGITIADPHGRGAPALLEAFAQISDALQSVRASRQA
jgi:protein-tyrosine phosphatase